MSFLSVSIDIFSSRRRSFSVFVFVMGPEAFPSESVTKTENQQQKREESSETNTVEQIKMTASTKITQEGR
jgi:hypothetical protein